MAPSQRPSFRQRLRHWLVAAGKFKSLWQYLLFVAVAGVFWFIMALNDEVQTDFTVKVEVTGVPASVTFIDEPIGQVTVTVRDKGTMLLRRKLMEQPVVRIPFSEFSSANRLRVSSSAMMNKLRSIFGNGATVSTTSTDSISVYYTSTPGKVVPVRVDAQVTAALGKVINGHPQLNMREVTIYSVGDVADTIMYVTTMPIVRRNLSAPLKMKVGIRPIKGVRIEPTEVEVTIPVEPLENRKIIVPVEPTGVPAGESLALFPQKVELSYLVPMSMNEGLPASAFKVVADYADISKTSSAMVRIKIAKLPEGVESATLPADSVEYTIIRSLP